jgi:hypothetical protein
MMALVWDSRRPRSTRLYWCTKLSQIGRFELAYEEDEQYLSIVHNRVLVEINDDGLNESTILVDALIFISTCIAIYKAP